MLWHTFVVKVLLYLVWIVILLVLFIKIAKALLDCYFKELVSRSYIFHVEYMMHDVISMGIL